MLLKSWCNGNTMLILTLAPPIFVQEVLASDGVRVNAICPDFVNTAMVRETTGDLSSESREHIADMGLIRCVVSIMFMCVLSCVRVCMCVCAYICECM